jgi:hypothetical protein
MRSSPSYAAVSFLPSGCTELSWRAEKLGLVKIQIYVGFSFMYQVSAASGACRMLHKQRAFVYPHIFVHTLLDCCCRRWLRCCGSALPCFQMSASAALPPRRLPLPPLTRRQQRAHPLEQAAAYYVKLSEALTASCVTAADRSACFVFTLASFKSTRAATPRSMMPNSSPIIY